MEKGQSLKKVSEAAVITNRPKPVLRATQAVKVSKVKTVKPKIDLIVREHVNEKDIFKLGINGTTYQEIFLQLKSSNMKDG